MLFNYSDFQTYRDFTIANAKTITFEQTCILAGWIEATRTHAKLVFFELKDETGCLQCIVHKHAEHFAQAQALKQGDVVRVTGRIIAREPRYVTTSPLGDRELQITSLVILSHARVPYDPQAAPHEATRMTYRYFDLRDTRQAALLRTRSAVIQCVHQFFMARNFTYVETPILMKSTPEGARDFLVFSRQQKGYAYALPQSPQLFKQMLMVGQVDKYYQLARCFRDEDFRANRQPEFTQIDVEMAFVNVQDVKQVISALVCQIATQVFHLHFPQIPEMTYTEAMRLYGNDAPDLSIQELILIDLSAIWPHAAEFALGMKFHGPTVSLEAIRPLIADYLTSLTLFGVISWHGQPLVLDSNYVLPPALITRIITACGGVQGDVIFFGADAHLPRHFSNLRKLLAKHFQLQRPGIWPLWVEEFPMFALNENQVLEVLHHPFTCPAIRDHSDLIENPLSLKSYTYDLVINGEECCGGSLRTIDSTVVRQVLQLLGHSPEQIQERFGFFLQALETGAPPHGGFAIGLERLIMVLAAEPNIRNIITFPKTQTGNCLMTSAPSKVTVLQMQELGLSLDTADESA